MKTSDTRADRIAEHVRAVPGWEGRETTREPAIAVLASPSWRGVDGDCWRIRDRAGTDTLFVKEMTTDAAIHVDIATAFAAARRASDLGIGPKVHVADVTDGILVMEDLDEGWRVCTLDRLLDPKVFDAIHDTRTRFRAGAALPRTTTVFDEIARFHREAAAVGAVLPADIDWLVAEFALAEAALRATAGAGVPIHGDGNVSNVLLGPGGAVRLVDWDRATTADPHEDLGSLFVEAFTQEPEARDAFTRVNGGFDRRAFDRVRLYGIADDLRWGLIGALVSARSPRKTTEFYKFASWRFTRCRLAIHDARFGEMLRRLG